MVDILKKIASDFGSNSGLVEELYELWKRDPNLVSEEWRDYFASLNGSRPARELPEHYPERSPVEREGTRSIEKDDALLESLVQHKVEDMIAQIRRYGHFWAQVSPLKSMPHVFVERPDISLESFNFSEQELDIRVQLPNTTRRMTVSEAYRYFADIYMSTVGFEFEHLVNEDEKAWFINQIETGDREKIRQDTQLARSILKWLVKAWQFEVNLHKRYIGHKRFSLEGAETLIPMLFAIRDVAICTGVKDITMGMAHRGRLNVLVNFLEKKLQEILDEFEDESMFSSLGSGDVKYHIGYSNEVGNSERDVNIELAYNPSHLEFIYPVIEGMARSKQEIMYQGDYNSVLPVVLHGDAAVIGQGVVAETANFSRTRGYETGGTIHIIVNNQIGFTTYPYEGRSAVYASDTLKSFDMPVIHVNAEDPFAAYWVANLAAKYRTTFNKDIVLDLYCYRKHGHNEADDPSYTQPHIYSEIKAKKPIPVLFFESLKQRGTLGEGVLDEEVAEVNREFENAYENRGKKKVADACATHGRLRIMPVVPKVSLQSLNKIARSFVEFPEGFSPNPKLVKILEKRISALERDDGVDWAFAEALAFGSLLLEGYYVRLSGQDCIRGTFSQRHLGIWDVSTGKLYFPLDRFADKKGQFMVCNSTLSENGVMGFEFGYSTKARKALVCWEAQFGDFANGAQVIIDQFVVSCEAKWGELAGLTLLLPHGFEGQGPEHSSARLERFLQLAAEGNIRVCYPTLAAQYFHLLREQAHLNIPRPLIIMTPKSMIRSPKAASSLKDLTYGQFHSVLLDRRVEDQEVRNIVFITGKFAFDVMQRLEDIGDRTTVTIRLEELYPFPKDQIKSYLSLFRNASNFFWVQEEPENMAAWRYAEKRFKDDLGIQLRYIGRPESATTATGSARRHAREQEEILATLEQALASN